MTFSATTIILFVHDVEKLKQFYIERFGFGIVEETAKEWVLLNAGACMIGLHKTGQGYGDSDKKERGANGNTKIVFETTEDIVKLHEALLKQQVRLKEIKTFEGYNYWLCDGVDPEGNVFQIRQQKAR